MLNAAMKILEPSRGISRRQFVAAAAIAGAGIAAESLVGCRQTQPETPQSPPVPKDAPSVSLNINGKDYAIEVDPRSTLLDVLREQVGLTGTKKGCDHGQCGACTVLIDGRRINSCLQLAIAQQDKKIVTIEGLSEGDNLHPMQAAFIEQDAFQCGYCTPGQICSAVGLITENHAHSDDEIREQMSGNVCRCGAYVNIVAAVSQAMEKS
jgi:xanthine dehydrogenase YagT iron-sulfur-binding subunit